MARKCSEDGVTRLDSFLREHALKPANVAREAGISRQHLLRIRKAQADPTVMTALRIRDACGRLLSRSVTLADVFEVE